VFIGASHSSRIGLRNQGSDARWTVRDFRETDNEGIATGLFRGFKAIVTLAAIRMLFGAGRG